MSANTARVGLDCHLYRNTGTYNTPTWTEITEAKDVTLTMDAEKAEAFTRGSAFKQYLPSLLAAPLEFDLLYDNAKTTFGALQAAFTGRTTLDVAIADGVIASSGTEYFRADYFVFGFGETQPLVNAVTVPVKLDLAYSAHVPAFVAVP